jgi:AraC-like DNA-binding protein
VWPAFVLDIIRMDWYKGGIKDTDRRLPLLSRIESRQLARLFDLLPDVAFFVKDRQGRFQALNRRGCEFCGVPSERAALGKTDFDFVPHSRAAEYQRDDRQVLRSGRSIVNRVESEPQSTSDAAKAHFILTSKIPLRDTRKRVIGLAGISRRVEQVRERPAAVTRLAEVLETIHDPAHAAVTNAELALRAGLSVSQFERVFRSSLGLSPRQYLVRIRVEESARALAEGHESITAIAQRFGFYDHAHFTRSFRKIMGTTPSAYRREHHHPQAHG